MRATSGRRRSAGPLLLGHFDAAIAAVLLFAAGCSTMRPAPGTPAIGGSSTHLLAACEGGTPEFCEGFEIAILDHEVAAGNVCFPAGATLDDVTSAVVAGLRAAAPGNEEAHEIVASSLASKWPCRSTPATNSLARLALR